MEGTLLKWTNYWNGWQPRWFVLKDGVLSYYNSQNDTNSGCKRSFKISMFDIIVNRTDSTRMDLIVANDQHLYLKACDYRERQKWLVAIATQKASYPNSTNEQQYIYESSNLLKCKQSELRLYCDLLMQQIHEMKNLVNTEQMPQNEAKKIDEITSNVNVTCEMLMNIVKNIIVVFENQNQHQLTNINGVSFNNHTNTNFNHQHQHHQNLLNNSNLASLKEMLNENLTLNLNHNQQTTSTPNSLTPPQLISSNDNNHDTSTNLTKSYTITNNHHSNDNERKEFSINSKNINGSATLIHNLLSHNIHITNSKLLIDNFDNSKTSSCNDNSNLTHKRALSTASSASSTYSFNSKATSFATVDSGNLLNIQNTNIETKSVEDNCGEKIIMKKSDHHNKHGHHHHHHNNHHHGHHEIKHNSFFINLEYRFENIQFIDNDQIPTEEFLNCCRDVFKILDIFGSTTFLPVKIDVTGNINKLAQKFSTNEKKYHTLQAIVQTEIDENLTTVKNSATDALLWLKRGIWFLREFFHNFVKPNSDISDCIQKSYSKTLKKYHNWVVRGIFSLALRSVPTKDNFFLALSIDQSEFYNYPVEFEKETIKDIKNMLVNIDKILNTLNTFYTTNNLDENNPVLDD